jgi:hypothetical protein
LIKSFRKSEKDIDRVEAELLRRRIELDREIAGRIDAEEKAEFLANVDDISGSWPGGSTASSASARREAVERIRKSFHVDAIIVLLSDLKEHEDLSGIIKKARISAYPLCWASRSSRTTGPPRKRWFAHPRPPSPGHGGRVGILQAIRLEDGRIRLPGDVIQAAERAGHIDDIGRIVLSKTCERAATWEHRACRWSPFRCILPLPIQERAAGLGDPGALGRYPPVPVASRSMTSAVIDLAHSLNLSVVAEDVETMAQLDWLEWASCDHYQGYLFAPLMPGSNFETELAGIGRTIPN